MELIATTCICGETKAEFLFEKQGRRIGRCERCRTARTLAVPTDYESRYASGLDYHGEPGLVKLQSGSVAAKKSYFDRYDHDFEIAKIRWKRYFETNARRAKLNDDDLPEIRNGLSLIDFGCGNGAFMGFAKSINVEFVEGIEINSEMAELATSRTGCTVHRDIAEIDFEIDVLTMHDVIEHLLDPEEILLEIRKRMNPDGVVIVDTPDAGEGGFNRLGAYWHHCKPLEHVWFLEEGNLRALLAHCGFDALMFDRPIAGKIVGYFKATR